MDQRRDWCRTCHRIGQPDEERNLCRLASHAQKQEERDGGNQTGIARGNGRSLLKDLIELQTMERPEHQERRDQKAKVADAVGDHGFLGRVGICPRWTTKRIHLVPKSNQQERAKSHAFPAHKEHQIRIAAHEDHHHEDKQIEKNKEAAEPLEVRLEAHILMHVSDGIDMNQRANTGDNQHHRRRKRIDAERPIKLQSPDMNPFANRPAHSIGMLSQ